MIRRPLIFCILCQRPSCQLVSLHLEGNLRSPICSLPPLPDDVSSLLLHGPIALIISVHGLGFRFQERQILGRTSSSPTEGQHPCFLSYPPRLDLGRSLVCQLSPLARSLSVCQFQCRVSDRWGLWRTPCELMQRDHLPSQWMCRRNSPRSNL